MRRCMAAASPGAGPNDLSPLFPCTNRGGRACGRRHARQPGMPRTCIWYHGTLGLPAASPPCHIGPTWSLQLKSESAATFAAPTVVSRVEGLSLRRRLGRLQAAHDHPGWARRCGVSGKRLRDLIVVGPTRSHESHSRLKNVRLSSSCAACAWSAHIAARLNASSALDMAAPAAPSLPAEHTNTTSGIGSTEIRRS